MMSSQMMQISLNPCSRDVDVCNQKYEFCILFLQLSQAVLRPRALRKSIGKNVIIVLKIITRS